MGQITRPWRLLQLKEHKEMQRGRQAMSSALGSWQGESRQMWLIGLAVGGTGLSCHSWADISSTWSTSVLRQPQSPSGVWWGQPGFESCRKSVGGYQTAAVSLLLLPKVSLGSAWRAYLGGAVTWLRHTERTLGASLGLATGRPASQASADREALRDISEVVKSS